jgi:hypothetical protein
VTEKPTMTISVEQYRSALGSAIISAVAVVGFLAIYLGAGSLGQEAAFFPRLVAVLGGMSAAIALAESCYTVLTAKPDAQRAGSSDKGTWTDFFVSYGGPPLYGLMVFVFGFWAASAVGIPGLLYLLGERRPLFSFSITGGTLLIIYVVFDLCFDIKMPGSFLYEIMVQR